MEKEIIVSFFVLSWHRVLEPLAGRDILVDSFFSVPYEILPREGRIQPRGRHGNVPGHGRGGATGRGGAGRWQQKGVGAVGSLVVWQTEIQIRIC